MSFLFRSGILRSAIELFFIVNLVGAAEVRPTPDIDFWYSHSITVIQNGDSSEVIGVKGSKPEILNKKGKKSPLADASQFDITRSENFCEGYIHLGGLQLERVSASTVTEDGVALNNMGDGYRGDFANLEVVADRDIEDCYLVLIIINIDYAQNSRGEMRYSLRFGSLGSLKAGKKKNASVILGRYMSLDDIIPAVFSHGKEINSNMSPKVAAHARIVMEQKNRRRVARYLEESSNESRPAACIYHPYPHMNLARTGSSSDFPSEISVVFSLDITGNLASVRFPSPLSPSIQQRVLEIFNEWFFLPEIKNGKAVPATVSTVIPLGTKITRAKVGAPK